MSTLGLFFSPPPSPLFFNLLLSYLLSSVKATNLHWLFAFDSLLCWVLCFYLYTKRLCYAHNMLEIFAMHFSNINLRFSSDIYFHFTDQYGNTKGQRNSLALTRDCQGPSFAANVPAHFFSHSLCALGVASITQHACFMIGKSRCRGLMTCPRSLSKKGT